MKHKSSLTEKLTEDPMFTIPCACDGRGSRDEKTCDHEPDQCPNKGTVEDSDSSNYFCDQCSDSWK